MFEEVSRIKKIFGVIIFILGICLLLNSIYLITTKAEYRLFRGLDDVVYISSISLVLLIIGFILVYFSKSKSLDN